MRQVPLTGFSFSAAAIAALDEPIELTAWGRPIAILSPYGTAFTPDDVADANLAASQEAQRANRAEDALAEARGPIARVTTSRAGAGPEPQGYGKHTVPLVRDPGPPRAVPKPTKAEKPKARR